MIDLTKYKTKKDLQDFTKALYTQVNILQEQNKVLQDKLNHSEELLKNSKVPEVKSDDPVESILYRELKYLDVLSKQGGLSGEETRQLKLVCDALIGYMRLQQNPEDNKKPRTKPKDVAKLLQMVKDNKDK